MAVVAFAHDCVEADIEALANTPAPAILVLGERHGQRSDTRRALQLIEQLQARNTVTLAMEAVHEKNQAVLDAYATGQVKARKLPAKLAWSETWGYPFKPYKKLVTGSHRGIAVVAAGIDLGPKPDERDVPMPEGYAERMMASIGDHLDQMSPEVQERFPVSMTWRDFRIGELALQGWDGNGYLVILVGRGHVEGGQGTNWQLTKLQEAPVHSVVLDHEDAECLSGDAIWPD